MLLDARVIMANFQHKKIGLIRSFMLSHIYWCMETLLNTILANFTHRNVKKIPKNHKNPKNHGFLLSFKPWFKPFGLNQSTLKLDQLW